MLLFMDSKLIKGVADSFHIEIKKAEQILKLIKYKENPIDYPSVKKWIIECYNSPSIDGLIMCALNEILEGHGIESIKGEWQNGYWCDIQATYVNMGDTYAMTIINDRDLGFVMTCIGDHIEHLESEGKYVD